MATHKCTQCGHVDSDEILIHQFANVMNHYKNKAGHKIVQNTDQAKITIKGVEYTKYDPTMPEPTKAYEPTSPLGTTPKQADGVIKGATPPSAPTQALK